MNVDARITTMTSREFNQDTARAKRAAEKGPVIVTERGRASHVLMSKAEYDRLEGSAKKRPEKKFVSIADALAHPESAHIDFDIPEFKGSWELRIPNLED